MPVQRPSLVILDVGHGSSAVILAYEHVVVVDTGRAADLLEFLDGEDFPRLDAIFLSHADADHIGGVIGILAASVPVARVVLNSDAMRNTALWNDLLFVLQESHEAGEIDFEVGLTRADDGHLQFGSIDIRVLAPSQELASRGVGGRTEDGHLIRANTLSAVLRVDFESRPVALLPGDLDHLGYSEYLKWCSADDLSSEVLVYPHHGGRSGGPDRDLATALAEAVAPQLVVFSVGRGQNRTPRPEIVDAIRSTIGEVRIACTELSEHCAPEVPENADFGHLSSAHARGKASHSCCAGSLIIPLEDQLDVAVPPPNRHLAFIDEHAPTALCRRAM